MRVSSPALKCIIKLIQVVMPFAPIKKIKNLLIVMSRTNLNPTLVLLDILLMFHEQCFTPFGKGQM